jgi:hypothetical protein
MMIYWIPFKKSLPFRGLNSAGMFRFFSAGAERAPVVKLVEPGNTCGGRADTKDLLCLFRCPDNIPGCRFNDSIAIDNDYISVLWSCDNTTTEGRFDNGYGANTKDLFIPQFRKQLTATFGV